MDLFWSLPKSNVVATDTSLRELVATSHVRQVVPGTIVSDPEHKPQRAFLCASGTLKVTKLLASGREILITILEPGSIWSDRAVLQGYWRDVFVETMSSAEIISIDKLTFERNICSDPMRLQQFMLCLSDQMGDALTVLEDFRGRDVASRLASVLIRFSKQYGVDTDSSVVINLAFTHQDLANMIGTARETVSRILARFRAKGYLRDAGPAKLEILELESLKALLL